MYLHRKVYRALKREGWRGTFSLIFRNLVALPRTISGKQILPPDDWFDKKYGVETATKVALSDLKVDSPNYANGMAYGAVTPGRFEAALGCLSIDHKQFTFIDFGSGKGRAVLLAAGLPFKSVIGVEFARELHEVAERNLATYTGPVQCGERKVVCEDATRFALPEGPLVIFMFNPFIGETMHNFIKNIETELRKSPREAYVLYVNPKMGSEFLKSDVFRPITQDPLHFVFKSTAGTAGEASKGTVDSGQQSSLGVKSQHSMLTLTT